MARKPEWDTRFAEHVAEARTIFDDPEIVGVFLQGSQNYGMDIHNSDVDTKCIVVPSFYNIAMNQKPVSTTHVRANNEHIDLKDVRLMIQTFRKQNLNFIEVLFTDYQELNPLYADEWSRLVDYRERIAHMNQHAAVKTMKGVASEKFHAMEHEYPSKVEVLKQYGYDCKQLHHLLRIKEFLDRYINGEPYVDCLRPRDPEFLKAVKLGYFNLDQARVLAAETMDKIIETADAFREKVPDQEDEDMVKLLYDVQYKIMRLAVGREFEDGRS